MMRIDLSGEVSFDAKPSVEILAALKRNGFRWSPGRRLWYKTSGGPMTAALADWLVKQERAEKGLRLPDAPCWKCKSPEGYFRRYGAATPVYCDACEAESRSHQDDWRNDPGELAADRWNETRA